jgi:hypothetical protein
VRLGDLSPAGGIPDYSLPLKSPPPPQQQRKHEQEMHLTVALRLNIGPTCCSRHAVL